MSGLLVFGGCNGSHQAESGSSSTPPPTPATVKGTVRGGQVPVAAASLQLYAVGTTGDGSPATPLLAQPITSDAAGSFSLTGAYTCPSSSSLVYVTASGGNPGLVSGTNNTASVLIAALGSCGSLPTSFIVNEVTTVAAIWPLASFMSSPSAIGSSAADASNLSAAFTLAAEFADVTTGLAPGQSVSTGTTIPADEINTLADILSTCVNSGGGVAGDGSACGQLFTLTTPAGGSSPTTIAAAGLFIRQNPTQNISQLFALLPTDAPFTPMLSIPPVDWGLHPAVPSALSVTPSSISFPSTIVNFTAASQTITLSNSGSTAIDISGIALTGANAGDFTYNNSCTSTLPANQSCTIQVSFSPTVTGSKYAYLTIANSATSEPVAIALTGTAVDGSGALSVSPTSLSFSQLSVPQTITLTNSSVSAMAIQSISLSNQNFTETNTCGNSISANASCTISVTATVANTDSATPLTGTLTIIAGDTIGVHTVPLSTSIAPVPGPLVVTPNALSFTVAGVPQSVTLTNSGSTVLTLQSITVGNPAFAQTNTCGNTLAPAATCTVSITVNSLGATALNSSLTIVANDAVGTHTVALSAVASGTLPPLSVSVSSLTFPSTLLHFSSPVQTFTITNNTPDAILYLISFTGAAANNYTLTDSCSYPLEGGQSCTEQVAFTPVTAGADNGSLEYTLNGSALVTIPVTGTGVAGTGGAVTLSPSSLTFTQFGVPAPVTVTNTGTTAVAIGPITLSDDSSDYAQTNNCGSSLDPQSVCTIEVSANLIDMDSSYAGTLTVVTGDATGIHTLPLSTPSNGGVQIGVSGPIAFGSWVVGTTSAPQTLNFVNRGAGDVNMEITGPDASAFSFDPSSNISSISYSGCPDGCSSVIYFTPSHLGPHTATLVTNYGNATLTGTGSPAGPSFVLRGNIPNPIYQFYGSGVAPILMPVTVTNNGSTPLNLSAAMTGANASQYVLQSQCPASLQVGSTCELQITFAPNQYGSLPAQLKVTDSVSGISQTLNFMGFGQYPLPTISIVPYSFGDIQLGSISAPSTATITAPGGHPVTISVQGAPFRISTTSCDATPCQVGVTFAPTATGSATGTVTVQDIVSGYSNSIYMTGTGGVPVVSLSPSVLDFTSRSTGTTSIAQVVTLTNSGNAPLNISAISIIGTNAADFVQTNTCSGSIAVGAGCTISISFAPSDVGNLTGTVQILSDGSPATIELTGTATAPSP
ncbi:choice-of-anchor D domain-containing protein [Edaphobacter dinghuensis]|uniref:choice-of-anchor D domain-containing protein n=1 Tax=Edaphobacter dinghuensis TaxID=1560005 RepID=UPI0021DF947C|nr:choice-of-anchor D domain-containing protein [Edaphobacter dinghuensis]